MRRRARMTASGSVSRLARTPASSARLARGAHRSGRWVDRRRPGSVAPRLRLTSGPANPGALFDARNWRTFRRPLTRGLLADCHARPWLQSLRPLSGAWLSGTTSRPHVSCGSEIVARPEPYLHLARDEALRRAPRPCGGRLRARRLHGGSRARMVLSSCQTSQSGGSHEIDAHGDDNSTTRSDASTRRRTR